MEAEVRHEESLRHMGALYDLLESFLKDFAERWAEAGQERFEMDGAIS